jgi:hypothetical protein
MTRSKPTQKLNVGYTLRIDPETESYVGNCTAPGKETWIRDQLVHGNQTAWCFVSVRAEVTVDGITFAGHDGLGCCSYPSEEELRADLVPEMQANALEDLQRVLREQTVIARDAQKRARLARAALKSLAA